MRNIIVSEVGVGKWLLLKKDKQNIIFICISYVPTLIGACSEGGGSEGVLSGIEGSCIPWFESGFQFDHPPLKLRNTSIPPLPPATPLSGLPQLRPCPPSYALITNRFRSEPHDVGVEKVCYWCVCVFCAHTIFTFISRVSKKRSLGSRKGKFALCNRWYMAIVYPILAGTLYSFIGGKRRGGGISGINKVNR